MSNDSKLRKDERGAGSDAARNQPAQNRNSVPTPASGARENLESSDVLELPLKNIKAININEDHRLEQEPRPGVQAQASRPEDQHGASAAPRAARLSSAGVPGQPVPGLQRLRVPGQKIHLAGFPVKNKISILKKNPASKP